MHSYKPLCPLAIGEQVFIAIMLIYTKVISLSIPTFTGL